MSLDNSNDSNSSHEDMDYGNWEARKLNDRVGDTMYSGEWITKTISQIPNVINYLESKLFFSNSCE